MTKRDRAMLAWVRQHRPDLIAQVRAINNAIPVLYKLFDRATSSQTTYPWPHITPIQSVGARRYK